MKFEATTVLNLTMKIGIFCCIWPLNPNTKFVLKLFHEIRRCLFIINEFAFIVPFMFSVYYNFENNSPKAIKALGDSAPHGNNFLNLFLWWLQQKQLQLLLSEASKYITNLKNGQKNILESYLNRYFTLLVFTSISCIGTIIIYSFSPLMLPQIFVTDSVEYPFKVQTLSILHLTIYLGQVTAAFQCGSVSMLIIAINTILATIVTTKLQALSIKIQKATNEDQLKNCIRKHQDIIRYAKKIDHVMRFIILKTYIFIAMTGIFAAIQIFFPRNFFHVLGALLYITTCLTGVYIFAWAADDMYDASINISWAVYNLNWTNCSPKMRKLMVIMMSRAKKPLDISVDGILPALTLEFFAKFILFIISYFMTLRALVIRT